MPTQLSRGQNFVDGGTGSAAQFHALVDNGRILPGAISEQVQTAPSVGDFMLFLQSQSSSLKKCSIQQLINAFPLGGDNNVFALRKLGSTAGMAARGDDPRFPAKLTGIRMANNNSPDTVAKPKELTFAAHHLDGATVIDWDVADVFYDSLTANKTYTFSNMRSGRMITVALKLNDHIVTWPALFGDNPPLLLGATAYYFTFIKTPLSPNPSCNVVVL